MKPAKIIIRQDSNQFSHCAEEWFADAYVGGKYLIGAWGRNIFQAKKAIKRIMKENYPKRPYRF